MKTEKGQALILIAVGMVVMLGLTALALDGGNAFADRRHAQNAADTAALSAALAKINSQDWQQTALTRAADNTYDNNGASNIVTVHNPPIDGPHACPAQHCADYIQVIIESRVDTWFARVVGIEQVNNRVQAVARAKPWREYFFGHSVVALSPGGKPSQPEFRFTGGALVSVIGSGVFVNSSDPCAIEVSNNTDLSLSGGITTGGGTACNFDGDITVSTIPQIPYPPDFGHLNDLCSRPNAIHISGDFPKSNTPAQLQNDSIYCISGGFKVTNSNTKLYGTGVTFVVSEGVNINGGELQLSSPSNLPLFHLPYASHKVGDNKYNVVINGNIGMKLRGMFLAPASDCRMNGTSNTDPLQGQLICYTVELGGTADSFFEYDDSDNMDEPPQVELTQ